jgi:hypothetical protein
MILVISIGIKMAKTIMEQVNNQGVALNIDMQSGEILDA